MPQASNLAALIRLAEISWDFLSLPKPACAMQATSSCRELQVPRIFRSPDQYARSRPCSAKASTSSLLQHTPSSKTSGRLGVLRNSALQQHHGLRASALHTCMAGAGAKTVLVPVANGSEEIEAVTIIDVLRRAGADVTVASVEDSLQVEMSRQVRVIADKLISDCATDTFDAIALPVRHFAL